MRGDSPDAMDEEALRVSAFLPRLLEAQGRDHQFSEDSTANRMAIGPGSQR